MSYKSQFRPNEHLIDGRWVPEPAEPGESDQQVGQLDRPRG